MAFSAEQILNEAQADNFYIGNVNVTSLVRWIADASLRSEVAVPGNSSDDGNAAPSVADENVQLVTFKFCGQILPQGTFLQADGNLRQDGAPWLAGRSPLQNLASGGATITVGPVPQSISPVLHAEWPKYMKNLKEILLGVLPLVDKRGFMVQVDGASYLKLSHKWFSPREMDEVVTSGPHTPDQSKGDNNDSEDSDSDTTGNGSEGFDVVHVNDYDSDREEPFKTVNAPVQLENKPLLQQLAMYHQYNPLHAYMRETPNIPLQPDQYASVLPGSIAQLTFTLTHRLMKRGAPYSHFTATLDELEIIQRPAKFSLSPSKLTKKDLFRKRRFDNKEPGPSSKRRIA